MYYKNTVDTDVCVCKWFAYKYHYNSQYKIFSHDLRIKITIFLMICEYYALLTENKLNESKFILVKI